MFTVRNFKENIKNKENKEKEKNELIEKIKRDVARTGIFNFKFVFGETTTSPIFDFEETISMLKDLLGKEKIHSINLSDFFSRDNYNFEKNLKEFLSTIKDNKTLIRLEISNFSFPTVDCTKEFLQVLASTQISELHLINWNSEIQLGDGMINLLTLFADDPYIQKLSSFDINHHRKIRHSNGEMRLNKEKGEVLISLLKKANFKELNLSGYRFLEEGHLKKVCDALSKMTALKKLNFSNMLISNKDLSKLVEALKNKDLEELDLSNGYPNEPLNVELLKPLLEKRTLRRLGFAGNQIGTKGFQFLLPYFKGESSITRINLQDNDIDLKKVEKDLEEIVLSSRVTELGICNPVKIDENFARIENKKREEEETGVMVKLLKNTNSALQVFPLGFDEPIYEAGKSFYAQEFSNIRLVVDAITNSNFSLTSVKHGLCAGEYSYIILGKSINCVLERNQRLQYHFYKCVTASLKSHFFRHTTGIVLDYLGVDLNYGPLFIQYAYELCTDGQTNEQRLISRLKALQEPVLKKIQEEEKQRHEQVRAYNDFHDRSRTRMRFLDDDSDDSQPRRLNLNFDGD